MSGSLDASESPLLDFDLFLRFSIVLSAISRLNGIASRSRLLADDRLYHGRGDIGDSGLVAASTMANGAPSDSGDRGDVGGDIDTLSVC